MTTTPPPPQVDRVAMDDEPAATRAEAALALTQQQERTQALRREVHLLAEGLRADVSRLDNLIGAQGAAIQGQMSKVETLSTERVDTARREAALAHAAAEAAIDRAESTVSKRLDALAEHVTTQLTMINTQLTELHSIKAADKLQAQRIDDSRRESQTAIETLRREASSNLHAAQQAIDKAERATEKRFEGVNEFRAQLQDQAQRFMPREVADSQFSAVRGQLTVMQSQLDKTTGKSQGTATTIAYAVTGATLLLSLVIFLANYVFQGGTTP